jgi:lysophospholipase L1-like esterase
MFRKTRPVNIWLLGCLAASVGLNVFLYRLGAHYYRDGEEVRLDPTSARVFTPLNSSLKSPEKGQRRVVFVGDSRIEQWASLPALAGCELVNRGRGGETTAQVALRLSRDVLDLKPNLVVIEVGVNDLKSIGVMPEREQQIIDNCRDNLRGMVSQLRERQIPVLLLTIFPVGPIDLARRPIWSDATLTAVAAVNEFIRQEAGSGVTVLDCDAFFARNGRMNPDFARDAFHLKPAGYEALNEAIQPVLEKMLKPNS